MNFFGSFFALALTLLLSVSETVSDDIWWTFLFKAKVYKRDLLIAMIFTSYHYG
jgi:hypothetical protein